MINLFTLLLIASIAGAIGFFYIPWVGRLIALYALHGIRDRVYAIGEQSIAVSESVIYRDLLTMLSTNIYVLRELRLRDVITFSGTFSEIHRRITTVKTQPEQRYAADLEHVYVGESGNKILDELLRTVSTADLAVALRLITGHPLFLFLTCSTGIVVILIVLAKEWKDRFRQAFSASPPARASIATFVARRDAIQRGAHRLGLRVEHDGRAGSAYRSDGAVPTS